MWFELYRHTLLKYIARRARQLGDSPSLYIGIERIILLMAISLLIWTYAGHYVLIGSTVIFTALPLFSAFVAANLTLRISTSPQYQLIALTPISDRILMRCFYETVINRVRRGLVVAGVIIPMIVLGALLSTWDETVVPGETSFKEAGLPLIQYVGLGFVLWGMNLVGVALGVGLGIWWRNSVPMIVAPALVILIMLGLVSFLVNVIDDATLSSATRAAVIGAMIPYVTPWVILRLAEPLARRQHDT